MKIEILKENEYKQLDDFLYSIDHSLIYYSSDYKKFLDQFLKEKTIYFILKENNRIIALLPAVLKENKNYGNVLNSLPFYGSNGAVISLLPSEELKKILVKRFTEFALEMNCISSTIITSPFEKNIEWYEKNIDYTFKDQRIGQITPLPDSKEKLMDILHSKTRNTVRKAQKEIRSVDSKEGLKYIDFIAETHKENMIAVNGLYKPYSFFQEIVKAMEYEKNLKIYIAFIENNIPVSGLMNLYFNKTIEYFCPVTVSSYRELQSLSGLIYQAMSDGIDAGYKWWNWGGTWLSQGGVYQFKSRWGTQDNNYYYFTKVYDDKVMNYSREILLKEYPYFFVIPFSALGK